MSMSVKHRRTLWAIVLHGSVAVSIYALCTGFPISLPAWIVMGAAGAVGGWIIDRLQAGLITAALIYPVCLGIGLKVCVAHWFYDPGINDFILLIGGGGAAIFAGIVALQAHTGER